MAKKPVAKSNQKKTASSAKKTTSKKAPAKTAKTPAKKPSGRKSGITAKPKATSSREQRQKEMDKRAANKIKQDTAKRQASMPKRTSSGKGVARQTTGIVRTSGGTTRERIRDTALSMNRSYQKAQAKKPNPTLLEATNRKPAQKKVASAVKKTAPAMKAVELESRLTKKKK